MKTKIILATLLSLSILLNGWLIFTETKSIDEVNALASTNYHLANEILIDGLKEKTIRLYVWRDNEKQSYRFQDYDIRVIPLQGLDHPSWAGMNFLDHNAHGIFRYSCHIFESNRELAIHLLNLISDVSQSAHVLLANINDDGSISEAGRKSIDTARSNFQWLPGPHTLTENELNERLDN